MVFTVNFVVCVVPETEDCLRMGFLGILVVGVG